jgi:hypothetical protein
VSGRDGNHLATTSPATARDQVQISTLLGRLGRDSTVGVFAGIAAQQYWISAPIFPMTAALSQLDGQMFGADEYWICELGCGDTRARGPQGAKSSPQELINDSNERYRS